MPYVNGGRANTPLTLPLACILRPPSELIDGHEADARLIVLVATPIVKGSKGSRAWRVRASFLPSLSFCLSIVDARHDLMWAIRVACFRTSSCLAFVSSLDVRHCSSLVVFV